MLHQNWFMDERFEMFIDYGEYQCFYDTETKNIYVIFEEREQKGITYIKEIIQESFEYNQIIKEYKKWKQRDPLWMKLFPNYKDMKPATSKSIKLADGIKISLFKTEHNPSKYELYISTDKNANVIFEDGMVMTFVES